MALTVARAAAIGREFGGWFGTPMIVSDGANPTVYDGRVRIEGLSGTFDVSKAPRVVIVSRETRVLVRALALVGHPDRAWEYLPDCWRDSVDAIASFAGIDKAFAIEVFAAGREKLARETAVKRNQLTHATRVRVMDRTQRHSAMVRNIREGLRLLSQGETFTIKDVARIVGEERLLNESSRID